MSYEITIAGIGQSNLYGASSGDNANFLNVLSAADLAPNPKVLIWNNRADGLATVPSTEGTVFDGAGAWEVFDISSTPRQYGSTVDNTAGPNLMFFWAKRLQEMTGATIKVIIVGHGNQGIEHFTPSGSENGGWVSLQEQITASGTTNLDHVVFAQGEWDDSRWSNQGNLYLSRFLELRTSMDSVLGVNSSVPMFVVQPVDSGSQNITDEVFNELPKRDDYTFETLPTRLLPTSDGLHFSSESYAKIGQELLPTAWAAVKGSRVKSLSVSVVAAPRASDLDDYSVTVTFEGTNLSYSDDLTTWTPIVGATSPHTQIVPRESKNRHYKAD